MLTDTLGNPLFASQLLLAPSAEASDRPTSFDELVGRRVRSLPVEQRRALELACVSTRPVAPSLIARALNARADAYGCCVSLCSDRLLRAAAESGTWLVEPYHDRVRAAVLRGVPPDEQRQLHELLALQLSSRGDPEQVMEHWLEAGHPQRATPFALRAAQRAARLLAFDHAARLYTIALDAETSARRRSDLLARLAAVLSAAGRNAESAAAYRAASEHAPHDIRLRERAAGQLLLSGDVIGAREDLLAALSRIGIELPSEPEAAIAARHRIWQALEARGYGFQPRAERELEPSGRERIELLYAAALGLFAVDAVPLRAAIANLTHLSTALDAGDPFRILRAACLAAMYAAMRPDNPMLPPLLALADRARKHVRGRRADAWMLLAHGTADYHAGRIGRAAPQLTRAVSAWKGVPGVGRELGIARLQLLGTLDALGRLPEARELRREWLEEAQERGDRFGLTMARLSITTLIAAPSDDEASAEIERVKDVWRSDSFDFVAWLSELILAAVDALAGRPEAGWQRIETVWQNVLGNAMSMFPAMRCNSFMLRAVVALALLRQAPGDSSRNSRSLVEAVSDASREIRFFELPSLLPFAALLEARLALVSNDRARAESLLVSAVQGLSGENGNRIAAECTRWLLAMTRNDAPGQAAAERVLREDLGITRVGVALRLYAGAA